MRDNSKVIILLIIIILAIGIGSYFFSLKKIGAARELRQAVFLTSGQIYFGNLTQENDQFIKLSNVFYPQSADFLQSDSNKKKVTLQRLGEELHGPENTVYINRDQILYYENMRKDSKINEAINKYIEDKAQSPSPESSPTPTPTAAP